MSKKKLQSKQTRQARLSKKVVESTATSKRVKALKKYNNTIKALKAKHGINHKTAQATYRHLVEQLGKNGVSRKDVSIHPRITKRAVRSAERDLVAKSKEEKQIESAKLSANKIIEQAIRELSENAPAIRHSITDSLMEHSLDGDLLVKITVKGKDYTRVITGNIVKREGSKILKWKWTSNHHGRRHRRH